MPDDREVMPVPEALAVAGQMRNHWRAFERLEEVLATAGAADASITEKKRIEKQLQDSITNLQQEEEKAHDTYVKRRKDMQEELQKAEEQLLFERQAKLDQINQEIKTKQDELSAISTEVAEKDADAQAHIRELEQATKEAQDNLASAEREYSSFKRRIAGA